MALIKTRDFGETEVHESDIFTFPSGLFGFEDTRRYALLSPLGENVYPMWFQCVDDISPCFIVFNPALIVLGYSLSLNSDDRKILKLPPVVSDNNNSSTDGVLNVKLTDLSKIEVDFSDYDAQKPKSLAELSEQLLVVSIAGGPEDYKDTTVNLKSPIVINIAENIGTQVILQTDYPFRFPVFTGDAL